MLDLADQIQSFFLTLMVGVVLGAIIHYYQLTIRKGRLRKYFLYALDFFLWIALMALIFACLVLINLGEMRVYVLIALVGGACLYYRYGAKRCHRALSLTAQATVTVFSKAKELVSRPVRWGLKKLRLFIKNTVSRENPADDE